MARHFRPTPAPLAPAVRLSRALVAGDGGDEAFKLVTSLFTAFFLLVPAGLISPLLATVLAALIPTLLVAHLVLSRLVAVRVSARRLPTLRDVDDALARITVDARALAAHPEAQAAAQEAAALARGIYEDVRAEHTLLSEIAHLGHDSSYARRQYVDNPRGTYEVTTYGLPRATARKVTDATKAQRELASRIDGDLSLLLGLAAELEATASTLALETRGGEPASPARAAQREAVTQRLQELRTLRQHAAEIQRELESSFPLPRS